MCVCVCVRARTRRDVIRLRRQAITAGRQLRRTRNGQGRHRIPARIKGHVNAAAPNMRKVLQPFCLRQINGAVFVKLNKATVNMTRTIEPYVACGCVRMLTRMLRGGRPCLGWSCSANASVGAAGS